MKLFERIIFAAGIIGTSVCFSGTSSAQDWSDPASMHPPRTFESPSERPCGEGRRHLKNEMRTSLLETLVEMSGQSQESVEKKLRYKPVWAVLDEFKIDVDAFEAKMRQKADLMLKKAIEEGRITQEQADRLSQRMEQGPPPMGRPGKGFGKGRRGFGMKGTHRGMKRGPCRAERQQLREEMQQARIRILIETTGQTEETIEKKLRYKPVWAILDEFKVDPETFQSKMRSASELVVQKAIADGRISQEQADFLARKMEKGPPPFMGRRHRGFGENSPGDPGKNE
ncbi:MAG: hypothetical protein GY866_11825 [Proteobacteria bacterium]|nr:hypothetical protein [Pseudomonadota bacterium]